MQTLNLLKDLKVSNPKHLRTNFNTKTIALAGNPNVGKSTVFNALTGLRQHTGNWPGKTVEQAIGYFEYNNKNYKLVDIPGTYSLLANSPEEEIARDFICFNNPDVVVIVVDATCIERNLNLVLQILEITKNVVVCLNLMDEVKNKKILIDTDELSLQLGGIPIVCTNARNKKGLNKLKESIEKTLNNKVQSVNIKNNYGEHIEKSVEKLCKYFNSDCKIDPRWISLRLLENDLSFHESLKKHILKDKFKDIDFINTINNEKNSLKLKNIDSKNLRDIIVESIVRRSENIYKLCVKTEKKNYDYSDRLIDKFLTSKLTGFPTMILFLMGIFWITITGANYPSEVISSFLFFIEDKLMEFFINMGAPEWVYGLLISGIYRTLAWVVSVMLPPMAIFFPLFTLLEDVGYLPRIAFNLDNAFKKCGTHGKQSLTMCMGFGCNACGVIGCRIIDSPRERLIAILTNNFVPCNGRFPLLISIITMFFIGNSLTLAGSFLSALLVTTVILFGIGMTFIISKILSKTLLKGMSSSFILELPPYRKPQVGKILVRSIFDRTIFVLGRAVAVAAPAGLIIWLMANIHINNYSILSHCSTFLNPFAKMIGLDGVILMAFILGFPANEIVLPIIIMSYMCDGKIIDMQNNLQLHNLLVSNGWNYITAVCVMLFSLLHFPCGTTCWTIKKETGSLKWTVLSFIIPTITGIIVCFVVSNLLRLISLIA